MGKRSVFLAKLKDKTEKCMANRKNANFLVDIILYLREESVDVITSAIKSLHKIFSHYLDVEEMCLKEPSKELTNGEKYKVWLQERYHETTDRLLELLQHDLYNVKEIVLSTLLRFIQKETKHPLNQSTATIPVSLLKKVVSNLLSTTVNNQSLFSKLQTFLMYDDVRLVLLKHVKEVCQEKGAKRKCTEIFLENVFALLDVTSMPETPVDKPLSNCLCNPKEKDQKIRDLREHRRLFSGCWIKFLQFKLPPSLYRKVLINLHDKVVPHMTNPLMLSDFLTVSYSIGGAVSLLSLNSLFILIHKHNLEYPDFYKNLYALFEPTVFHVKYRSRFFHLSNLFLSSTHLPAYLVAAFAKRLARISLTAPVVALKIVIPFIYNLMNRHPMCKQLIHRPNMDTAMMDDPYLPNEPDPAKCRAMDSCLWELKTLQEHYYPEVVYSARKMDHTLPDLETDISELLDITVDEIFEKECSKKIKKVPVTFEPPKGILVGKDDRLKLCWTL